MNSTILAALLIINVIPFVIALIWIALLYIPAFVNEYQWKASSRLTKFCWYFCQQLLFLKIVDKFDSTPTDFDHEYEVFLKSKLDDFLLIITFALFVSTAVIFFLGFFIIAIGLRVILIFLSLTALVSLIVGALYLARYVARLKKAVDPNNTVKF